MRFGVSIILLVVKQKKGSDSTPKGSGNVASRPCVLEFVVVACGLGLVGGRHQLVVDSVARGLYVDATLAGYHSFAVGLVRRRDVGRSILGRSSDRAAPVHAGDGDGPHLPGLHQAVAPMDGGIGRVAATGAARAHAEGTGRLLAGRRVCDVRRRREPGRTSPDAVSRRGVFVRASKTSFPQGTPRPQERGNPRQEINSPQLWLTTMWHVGTGLPWDWRIGPADSSERGHWLEMLPALPPGALMAVDAGFVGYEYTRAVLHSQCHVLLRVGSNVRLLKKLGFARERASTVYLWPDREAAARAPARVTAGGGSHRPASGVSRDQRALDERPDRPTGRRTVCATLGNRTLLSPSEADVSASQAPQCPRRECALRVGVVAGRTLGHGALCSSRTALGTFPRRG